MEKSTSMERRTKDSEGLTRREFLKLLFWSGAIAGGSLLLREEALARSLPRPPGAGDEREFLSLCIRCGRCIDVCPTKALKPASLTDGLFVRGTPILVGNCIRCYKCIDACPTGALSRNNLKTTSASKPHAEVDESRCIGCFKCLKACPVKAIYPKKIDGKTVAAVNVDKCIACGICEKKCPLNPPAIKVVEG